MAGFETEIVVVGAGPAGLIAALAVARAGAQVALVAPAAPPEDHRTSALLSGSVETLERLGVWASVAPDAAPLRIMRLVDGTRRLVRAPEVAFNASELGLEAFGYNVANKVLTDALAAGVAAEPRIVRVESTVEAFDLAGERPRLVLADGREIRARLVVAADGRNSRSREAAGISARSWSYPQTALVLNFDHSAPHYDTSTEFHTETGPFTLVPLGPRRSSLVCVVGPAEAERLAGLDDDALAVELERRAHSILGRFSGLGPRQTWPMGSLKADAVARGRVALVGEAAHAFPPIGAQGLNLGIRDVDALAEAVRRAKATGGDVGGAEVIDRYVRARRFDVASRVFGVDLLNRSLLSDLLPVQLARSVGLQVARDVGPIRKFLMREGLRPQLFQRF